MTRAQLIAALIAALVALAVLELVRRRRLSEDFSLLWVLATLGATMLAFWSGLLTGITHALGAKYETSTIFFFGILFVLVVLLYYAVKLTELIQEVRRLAQEAALLRLKVEEKEGDDPGAPREECVKGRSWQLILGVGVGVALFLFAMRGVDLPRLKDALAHANYWLLAPIIGLTVLAFYVRAVRWGLLLRTVKSAIPPANLFSATMIGFAANNLLPARLGEFIRAWAIGRSERISRSAAFATVVVERIVDVFALLFFFCLALLVHPFTETVRRAGWMLLGVNAILLFVLVLAERHPERVSAISGWALGHLPGKIGRRVHSLLDNFVVGLGVLRHGPAMGGVIAYSLLMYGLTLASIQAALSAFSFHVPWYASIVLLVSTSLGIIVAPTPGYVGAMQVACVWGLSLFGVDKSRAFSFSLYYHVSQFLPITFLGLWYLARQGLSLGDVAGAAGKEASEAA